MRLKKPSNHSAYGEGARCLGFRASCGRADLPPTSAPSSAKFKKPTSIVPAYSRGEVLAARDFRDSALYDSAYQRRFPGERLVMETKLRVDNLPDSRIFHRAKSGLQVPAGRPRTF